MKQILVIDTDYIYNRNKDPIVRIFGKDIQNNSDIILHVKNMIPYLYVKGLTVEKIKSIPIASPLIKSIEKIQKYEPIGYQTEKTDVIKIYLHDPKKTPELRKILEQIGGIVYEADIRFKARFMIDTGIDALSVIEFDEKGKELPNYGNNCRNNYICNIDEIKNINEQMTFEY